MRHFMKILISIVTSFFTLFSTELHSQVEQTKLFEQSKGKLILPIPKHKKVIDHSMSLPYPSEGISFLTDSAYSVKAVFEGTVVEVVYSEENNYYLTTKFGDYLIVYSNITKPNFEKGDYVKTGQVIGNLIKETNATNCWFTIILRKHTKSIPIYKWFNWKNGA